VATVPVPRHIDEFLSRPNPAVIATLSLGGAPVSVATWYDWEDGRILVNMDANRRRLAYLHADPRISLTVLNPDNWGHVSLRGRLHSLVDDVDLSDIDRLSRRYTGAQFYERERPRVSAWIDAEHWHSWGIGDD